VHGPQRTADLRPQQREHGAVLVRIQRRPMHEQARRLVDGDEVGVEVQHAQAHRR
jgi:hypothetical protein